ncbi:MAG: carboxypeptidase-like regulatory domain-containing protein [Pyrinomonadaceae bacterium]
MPLRKAIQLFLLCMALPAVSLAGQRAADTGVIKGKVRVGSGAGAPGVTVIAERDAQEVGQATSDRKGDFALRGLAPGFYKITFRKPGLSVSTIEKVEVLAGKERVLKDRLFMTVDDGTLAFVRGSVFAPDGRSVRGASVELIRIGASGEAKKIDARLTGETGEFVFRLPPDRVRYRVTVRLNGQEALTKDVDVDGAAV